MPSGGKDIDTSQLVVFFLALHSCSKLCKC